MLCIKLNFTINDIEGESLMNSKHVVGVAFFLVSSVAYALGPNLSAGNFGAMDTNGDGYLHEKELAADKKLSAQMDRLDKNKDDKLTEVEFGAFESPARIGGAD
jgi:hypothetical protein